MKKLVLLVFFGGLLAALAVAVPAHSQTPLPPPPGAIPPPPPPPGGGPTATPTLTPTVTPTATPIPLFVTIKLAHGSVKVGAKQKISVTTVPAATVKISVAFPNKSKKTHSGTADANGSLTWSYKQPSGKTTPTSNTANVTVTASDAAGSLKKSKKYKIT
jgi:hypothetical protein